MGHGSNRHRRADGLVRPKRALRIVYLAPADIQVARVDRQAIVYFCSAMARVGASIELVALGVRLASAERHRAVNPLELYRVPTEFPVEIVQTRLHQDSPSWQIGITRVWAQVGAAMRRLRSRPTSAHFAFYTKNYAPALALLALRRFSTFSIFFEAHTLPRSALHRFILRHVDGVVANSHALARDLEGSAKRVLPTHQGVDLRPYDGPERKGELRRRLGLPLDRRIAAYTGKIYFRYAEIEYIVGAAALPASAETLFVLVGGREDHAELWRKEVARRGLDNVVFTGFVAPSDVHAYQRAADVLLLYYPSGLELNAYRSPGKLFSYMAARVPIVSVDLPVLREVLGDPPAAVLVAPDSPVDLAGAVQRVLCDSALASRIAEEARERVAEFTWDARAKRVLHFLEVSTGCRSGGL